jgi:hypothetical protein
VSIGVQAEPKFNLTMDGAIAALKDSERAFLQVAMVSARHRLHRAGSGGVVAVPRIECLTLLQ